jgi:hypothetical protein
MDNYPLADQVEAWMQGRLTTAQITELRQAMANNPALAREVELHRLAVQAGTYLSEQRLKNNVLEWLTITPESSPAVTDAASNPWRKWAIAAAAIAFLLFLWGALEYGNIQQEQQKNGQLEQENRRLQELLEQEERVPQSPPIPPDSSTTKPAMEKKSGETGGAFNPMAYYVPPGDLGGVLRRNDNTASTVAQSLELGVAAFNNGRFKTAERYARQVLTTDASQREALRLLAFAQFRQGKYLEASHAFSGLSTIYPSKKEEAEWHLLLCYRALNDGKTAYKTLLRRILANPEHAFYTNAQQLK